MRNDRDRPRSDPGFFAFASQDDDDDFVVLDFSPPGWDLIDHQPERKRRARGCDPYNSAEQPPRKQPWLRIERR
jgi:hypothetical protein